METANSVVGIAGTVFSLTALLLVFYVERVRGPKLTISRGSVASDPRGFDYLHIVVRNEPYRGVLGTGLLQGVFTRQVAPGCTVTLRIVETNSAVAPWTALWSHAGQPEILNQPASALIPAGSRWDVQPTGEDYPLPVVAHWPNEAETYAHDGWNFCAGNRDPNRRIHPGTWTLKAIAISGQSRAEKEFRVIVPSVSGKAATLENA